MKSELVNKNVIAINAFAAGGAKFLNVFIILWAQHKLLNNLSNDEFSIYPLVAGFLFFLPMLSTLFTSPVQRFTTVAYTKKDDAEITTIVSTVFPILSVFCVLFLAIGLLIATNVQYIFRIAEDNVQQAQYMFGLIIISSSVQLLLKPMSVAFFATQKLVRFHSLNLAVELIRLAILLILFRYYSYKVIWLVVADTVASCLLAVTLAWISRSMIPQLRVKRAYFDRSRIREFLTFGLGDVGIIFTRLLRSIIPIWLLNRFADPLAVISFHLGQSAYRQSQKAWIPIRGTMGPPMISMYANNEMGRMRRTYYRASKYALWAILFVVTPLLSHSVEILNLYAGIENTNAALVMVFLLLRYPMQLLNALLPQTVRAIGRTNMLAIPMICGELFTAIAVFVAVALLGYGALGAAITSFAVSLIVELFVLLPIGIGLIQGSLRDTLLKSFLPGCLPCLVSLAVGFCFKSASISGIGQLLISLSPGCIVYALIAILLFDEADRRDLKGLASKVTSKFRRGTSG